MSASKITEGALKPTLSVFDVIAITVSAVTPANSIFVFAPLVIQQAGSGIFLSYVIAALLALMFAFCYAELGRAHNSAGGEYVYAKRVFGGIVGYSTFFTVLVMLLFVPPVLATGAASYLNIALNADFDIQTVSLIIVASSYLIGILNIKLNAWITGSCLCIEVIAVLVIVFLGFGNISQPVSVLFAPHIIEHGVLQYAPWALVFGAVGVALFSYNGYGPAVLLSEDMKCKGEGIHKAVLWSLALVVIIELVPISALLLGAPSLSTMMSSADPIGYLVSSHGSETLRRLISAGIFLSVFNAIVAIVIQIGRVVFSSGRDQMWTPLINNLFTRIHPRFDSPWLATLFLAIPSALLSFNSNLSSLASFSVVLLMLIYLIVALSALMSRILLHDRLHPYRMPLWPLPALVASLSASYLLLNVFFAASLKDILIIASLLISSVIFYFVSGRFSSAFQKL